MATNLALWDKLKSPPPWAKKNITGGRLSGMTDINPQWRFMAMTEAFGPVGIGWKYTIDRQWLEPGAGDVVCAFTNVSVYFKHEGEWSEAIPGNGGSEFVAKEKSGPYTSDEAFKMSLTDALSVAFKAIGVGGDVYCGSKYTPTKADKSTITEAQVQDLVSLIAEVGANEAQFCKYMQVPKIEEIQGADYHKAVKALEAKRGQR